MYRAQHANPATQPVDLCRRLREEIILGRLPHGRRSAEKCLTDHMRVKRGPARESHPILEGQDLTGRRRGRGDYFLSLKGHDA